MKGDLLILVKGKIYKITTWKALDVDALFVDKWKLVEDISNRNKVSPEITRPYDNSHVLESFSNSDKK